MVVGAAGCGMVYGWYSLRRRSLTNSLDAWVQLIDTKEDQDHHSQTTLCHIFRESQNVHIAFGFIKVQWSRAQIMLSIDLIIFHCASRLERHGKRETSARRHKTHLNRFLINFSPTALQ